jgi:hypothetical protein
LIQFPFLHQANIKAIIGFSVRPAFAGSDQASYTAVRTCFGLSSTTIGVLKSVVFIFLFFFGGLIVENSCKLPALSVELPRRTALMKQNYCLNSTSGGGEMDIVTG